MKEANKEHKTISELKALSNKYDFKFKIGSLNFETPLNKFLRETCKEEFESIIFHKNLWDEDNQKECSIMLLKDKLIKSGIITPQKPLSTQPTDSTAMTTSGDADTEIPSESPSQIPTTSENKEEKPDQTPILILEMKRIIDIDIYHDESESYYLIEIFYINDTSIENLGKITLRFDSYKEAQIFKFFVEKEKMKSWQQFFEKNIPISEPYIYQYHFFLKKVNSRGDEENRVIVLTDEYILNIDYQIVINKKNDIIGNEFVFKLHKPKWALSINSFEELQLKVKDQKKVSPNFMIKIKINQKINKKYISNTKLPFKNKSSTDFIFQNEQNCRFFIFQIKRLYFKLNSGKKYIKVTENK